MLNRFIVVALLCCGVSMVFAQEQAVQNQPSLLISNFEDPADLNKWEQGDSGQVQLTVEPRIASDTNQMLKVLVKGGDYPGISLKSPPKDWSKYQVLSMVVWSPANINLGIRIDDENSTNFATRFNTGIDLTAGRTLVQLPIEQIGKSIDVSKIRNLILFVVNQPPGLTLYFDDVQLGPWQSDLVEFIPYDQRYDLQPSMEIVTPHIPQARNLAGGPVRAFLLTGVNSGREVVEMMQRMDYEPSVMHWDRAWDINTWGQADFYGKRGHSNEYNLMQRYLASSMQGPEKFEVLVLHTPLGWNRFGKGARDAIVKRVEEGAGLVLVMPYPGDDQPWPEDLKKLSALVDMASDTMREDGRMRAGSGPRSSEPWRVVQEHPIVQGVPLNAVTVANLRVERYTPAEGAQVLVETEDGFPVVAVKTVGKGRVVTWAPRSHSLTPEYSRQDQGYRYWEVWYELLNRSAYWAAGREFARNGEPKPVEVAQEHVDPALSAVQWVNGEGKVTDWALTFKADAVERQTLQVKVTDTVNVGEPITVTFTLPEANAVPANAEVTVELREYDWRRVRTLLRRTLALSDMQRGDEGWSVQLPTDRVSRYSAEAVVELRWGDRKLRGWQSAIIVPEPVWNDYEISFWDGDGLPFMRGFEEQRMREFGATANSTGASESGARQLLAAGLRPHFLQIAQGLHLRNVQEAMRQWQATGDTRWLIRDPSLSDPRWLDQERRRLQNAVRLAAKYKPLSLVTADETAYTQYVIDFDLDWHPANIERYRKHLADKYGDIATFNAAMGTSFESFDQVQPITGADGKKPENRGLFNEWRAFNDDVWAGHFGWLRELFVKEYPQARLSVSGTQAEAVFNGIDWAKLMKHFDAVCDYGGRYQLLKRASFRPDYKSTPWGGYGAVGKSVDNQVWNNLLQNGAGMALFWWYSIKNPDLTYSKSGQDYQRVFAEIRAGIGRQFQAARPHYDPVAILWSPDSQRAAWLNGAMQEFIQTEAQVIDSLRAAGYRPYFISQEAVAAGELQKRGAKAIVLPMTLSLGLGSQRGGMGVLPALQTFAQSGGVVVATHKAQYDEFLKPVDHVSANAFLAPAEQSVVERLSAAGVRPRVSVARPDGSEAARTVLYAHELAGDPPAYLISPVRATRGVKAVVGADGVVHYVPSEEGGAEVETLAVDISSLGAANCYDVRRGQALEVRDGKVQIDVPAGEAMPIAVLPYRVGEIQGQVKRDDQALSITWRLTGAEKFVQHVMRVEVIDNATGKVDPFFSRNVDTGADGRGSVTLPLAIEDAGRQFTVKLRDVLTGMTVELR